jgi:hypothetical protein
MEPAAIRVVGRFKVLAVAIASDLTFDRHHLAVDSFGHRVFNVVNAAANKIGQPFPNVVATFFIGVSFVWTTLRFPSRKISVSDLASGGDRRSRSSDLNTHDARGSR